MQVLDLGIAAYLPVQTLQGHLRRAVSVGLLYGVLLLLEHHPVITLGANAAAEDVLDPVEADRRGVDVVRSERGGQCTLHAPGQLVAYPVLRVPRRDLRSYVAALEEVLLRVLERFHLHGDRVQGSPGLYLEDRKIASLGLRCEQGVASHGSALNVAIDLSLYGLITSCGDPSLAQTSMQQATGRRFEMEAVKDAYMQEFEQVLDIALDSPRPATPAQVADLLRLQLSLG